MIVGYFSSTKNLLKTSSNSSKMSHLLPEDVVHADSSQFNEQKPKGRGIPLKACVDCGEVWKYTHYCPAECKKCESCGKTGHYSRFCRSPNSQKEKNAASGDGKPHCNENGRSPQGQRAECKQPSHEDNNATEDSENCGDQENEENSNWEESYDSFDEHDYCKNAKKRKHSPTRNRNNGNDGKENFRDTVFSSPGGDQPVYHKRTKYAYSFSGKSKYNPQPEPNHGTGPGYTFVPGTHYESIELKKKLAKSFYTQGKYDAALSHYSRLTELCPNDAVIFNNRCACHMMLGQYENAVADAVKVVNLNPSSIKGYCRLIKCAVLLGNTTSVELYFSKLSQLDPGNETLQFERERLNKLKNHLEDEKIVVNEKNYDEALNIINDCLRISPQCLSFKLKKAEYLALLKRYDDSKKLVDEIIQKDPSNIEAKYVTGIHVYHDKPPDQTANYFKDILHLAPDHSKSLEIYKKAKRVSEAIEKSHEAGESKNYARCHYLSSSALLIDPENSKITISLYSMMAKASYCMGYYQQTINECTKAINIRSNITYLLTYRGKAHMKMRNYEEAIADFSKAHNLKGHDKIRKLLQEAEKLLASDKRDPYEILGVDKKATIQKIEKAYEDKAMIHHPDRHLSDTPEQKKMHETKFKNITLVHRNLMARLKGKKNGNANGTYP